MGWNLHQMDVKTNFFNGVIEEEVYIEQPQGFEVHGIESNVCRLNKSLYGLKKTPRACVDGVGPPNIQGISLVQSPI